MTIDMDKYLRDLSRGHGTWARAAGVDEHTINRQGEICDAYYQEYLPTEAIEIGGVLDLSLFTCCPRSGRGVADLG